ncbi:hypothetical protein B0O99DRAFT_312265 [Bisporella sp. PMI_857]|nr:hypothetical protein B0O99DRAFT_312265 [Bisporella sp. PMI_857]
MRPSLLKPLLNSNLSRRQELPLRMQPCKKKVRQHAMQHVERQRRKDKSPKKLPVLQFSLEVPDSVFVAYSGPLGLPFSYLPSELHLSNHSQSEVEQSAPPKNHSRTFVPMPIAKSRPRASKPKVRRLKAKTGCATCKDRRVKCDETKPHCIRCVKFGQTCAYAKPIHPSNRGASTVPIRTPLPATIACNPSASVVSNETESQYFQLFCNNIAVDLCGFYDSGFWKQLVAQECHSEPTIRHAIFALGALYRSWQTSLSSTVQIHIADIDDEHR